MLTLTACAADGGVSYKDITDMILAGAREAGLDMAALTAFAPVPLFTKQGPVIGSSNGAILFAEQPDTGPWMLLAHVEHKVNTMTNADGVGTSSTVSH